MKKYTYLLIGGILLLGGLGLAVAQSTPKPVGYSNPQVYTLQGLGDVTITAPSNLQALVYNSATSKWINGAGGSGGGGSIATGTAPGQIAWFNGTSWTYNTAGATSSILTSNGGSAPSFNTSLTITSVTSTNIYSGLYQGNANLTSITSTNSYSLLYTGNANLTSVTSTNSYSGLYTGNASLGSITSTNSYSLLYQGNANLGSITSTNSYSLGYSGNGVFTSISSTNLGILTQLLIPNSASLETTQAGAIGIDTTSNQLRFFGTATTTLVGFQAMTVTLASTSWTTGSTTIPLGVATAAETWASVLCYTDIATATVKFKNATNYLDTYIATSSPALTTFTTNNSFVLNAQRYIEIGNFTGTPNYLSCSIKKSYNVD